jgi:hypothetical protein
MSVETDAIESTVVRALIISWIRQHGKGNPFWTVDLFRHLTTQGLPADLAIDGMTRFVDEIVAVKTAVLP